MPQAKYCIECDEPIPAKRLAAVPDAQYCVVCQAAIGDTPLRANNSIVQDALVELSERDGGEMQNPPEPHECLRRPRTTMPGRPSK